MIFIKWELLAIEPDNQSRINKLVGGGSANKTYLFQQTKALLNPTSLMKFLEDNIKTMFVYMWYYPMYVYTSLYMYAYMYKLIYVI